MSNSRPARAPKTDLTVMLERTCDELQAIQELWPRFERLMGLRGRRMYVVITRRPIVEYYRRHDVIEFWVPVLAQSRRAC